MLAIPVTFVEDDKAQKIIEEYLNKRVRDMFMEFSLAYYDDHRSMKAISGNLDFARFMRFLYPQRFTLQEISRNLEILHYILDAPEPCVPTLHTHYAIHRIISLNNQLHDELEGNHRKELPQRDYVLEKMRETYAKQKEKDHFYPPEMMITRLENLEEYSDFYDWDSFHYLLDDYLVGEIRTAEMVEQMEASGVDVSALMVGDDERLKHIAEIRIILQESEIMERISDQHRVMRNFYISCPLED